MAILTFVAQATLSDALFTLTILASLYIAGYIVYQRHFHPLSKFPGPFLASITDLWQVHQFLSLAQPYNLTDLHEYYQSEFVRYGPDKLSVTSEDAIAPLYQKGGKSFPKTEFFEAYGAAEPNVFGMRDEVVRSRQISDSCVRIADYMQAHSVRRRHMSHSFSISSVKKMERYLDANIGILRSKIDTHIARGETFDLKKLLHYYMIDVLGELAFSQSFGVQLSDDESLVPPVVEHSLLAAATGAWPAMTHSLKKWLPLVPHQGLRNLFAGRKACADLASDCVKRRLDAQKGEEDAIETTRTDILTSLINAKHPDTGKRLKQQELETEAFGFIIAGTHTTSASTTLLLYHLLHSPEVLNRCVDEVDSMLPPLSDDQTAYSVTQVETALPFLRQCVRENFRITPVFTMPLARRVVDPAGVYIGGEHIPQGVSHLFRPF